jgi:hypothetical protein
VIVDEVDFANWQAAQSLLIVVIGTIVARN